MQRADARNDIPACPLNSDSAHSRCISQNPITCLKGINMVRLRVEQLLASGRALDVADEDDPAVLTLDGHADGAANVGC